MLSMQKNLSQTFFMILSLPATAMGLALSIQIATLSWFLTTKFGLNIHELGLVWSAGPLAGIIGQVVIGIISDKVWFWNGRRRPFILIGGFFASITLLALPSIDIISAKLGFEGIVAVAIAVALSLDLSVNISFNPTRSIIADVTPEGESRTKGYMWMQTISGSFAVGAYAVGAIWDNYVLIYTGVIVVFLFSIVPSFFIEEPIELTDSEEEVTQDKLTLLTILTSIRTLWGFLIYDLYMAASNIFDFTIQNYYMEIACLLFTVYLFATTKKASTEVNDKLSEFQKILAAHAFSWVGVFTIMIYLVPYINFRMPDLSATDESKIVLGQLISMAYLVLNAVAAVIPALLIEPLTKRFGRINTHLGCLLLLAVALLGFYLSGTTVIELYVLMFLAGFGWAAIISLPFAIMTEKIEPNRMGLFMGLFNLSIVLPQLVVTLGLGLFMNTVADKSSVYLVSFVAIICSMILWNQVKRTGTAKG